MYQNSFYPLRTNIGRAIPIKRKEKYDERTEVQENGGDPPDIEIISKSNPNTYDLDYSFEFRSGLKATENSSHYKHYFPNDRGDYPGSGMDTLPLPILDPSSSKPLSPFEKDTPLVSLFARGQSNNVDGEDISRRIWTNLRITLAEEALIGGICFGGYPYLPYHLKRGTNSSNFGLPREIKVSTSNAASNFRSGFLDLENSTTKQDITSHSGLHFIQIDPTQTDTLFLYLSDYPLIIRHIDTIGGSNLDYVERYGFIIPYFYVFEYQERTIYRPIVQGGFLGAKSSKEEESLTSSSSIDYEKRYDNKKYVEFTAASLFGQQRTYPDKGVAADTTGAKECFISELLQPNETITLYIQQAEEFDRCISGLRIFLPFVPKINLARDLEKLKSLSQLEGDLFENFPNLAGASREELEKSFREILELPYNIDINFCEKVRIRVFELDPIDGVSPLSVSLDEKNGKYSTLLAEKVVDELDEILFSLYFEGIRFFRSSTSKYFAIELTNVDRENGQIVIKKLEMIRSAHVSVHPRAARTQQIRNLHFRIIGEDLAEDYAKLGNEGFNFSIEWLVAGERKSILFQSNSLLDLLHAGVAKIFANNRRRSIEQETVVISDPNSVNNYEVRSTSANGWRRSETGEGISWNGEDLDMGKHPFKSHISQEIRTHNEILSPHEKSFEWQTNAIFGNLMNSISNSGENIADELQEIRDALEGNENYDWNPYLGSGDGKLVKTYQENKLFNDFSNIWKGIINSETESKFLLVEGTHSVTSSPFGLQRPVEEFLELVNSLSNFTSNPLAITEQGLDLLPTIISMLVNPQGQATAALALAASNSFGLSLALQPVGVGVNISASTSGGLLIPSFTYVNSFGTQGNIAKQALNTGYAYSQFLNNSTDKTTTKITEAKSQRRVTRTPVNGTDKERIKGAEVMWQEKLMDIVTGSIPLNFTLPATASKTYYRTADDSLRIRFGNGVGESISVDIWFDLVEEVVLDDY